MKQINEKHNNQMLTKTNSLSSSLLIVYIERAEQLPIRQYDNIQKFPNSFCSLFFRFVSICAERML